MSGARSHLDDIINNATAALLITDAQARCTYMNPAAEAVTGYTLDELRGRVLHDVLHHTRPDGSPLPANACPIGRAAAAAGHVRGEDVFIHRDGHFYDVAYAASVIRDGGAVVGTVLEVRDITEAKRAEARRTLLAGITEDIARGAALDDVLRHAAEGLARLLDARSCEFSEIDEVAGILQVATSFRHGRAPLRGRHRLDDVLLGDYPGMLRRGESVAVEDVQADARVDGARYAALGIGAFAIAPFVRDGEWRFAVSVTDTRPRRWRDDDLRLLRAVAARVFPHVERRRHDEALRLSEERFRLMADSVPHLVWILRGDGSVEFVNRQWVEYTGRAFDPSARVPAMTELVHPDDVATSTAAFGQALATGQAFTLEHRMRAASGDYRWFIVRAEPWRDPSSGEVVRWFGSSADIHDLKLAQQALADADQRKDEFLAMLAHELRNPLAPIATASHLLDRVADDPARVREVARVIGRQVGHIRELVDDLLDVSRVTRGLITLREDVLDVSAIVAGAVEQSRADIDARGHRLRIAQADAPLRVRGDRTRLIQVLANLLNNAAKYSPEGSRIDVGIAREGGDALISVADTGQGIDAGLLPHVFELFSQGRRTPERAHGGLGLGLALVRQLVQLHGGRVSAHSDGPGRGSRFVVRLPAVDEAPVRVEAEPSPGEGRSLHVIVVDDNRDAADTLAAALGLLGHRVEVHGDARAVLAARWPGPPDVFLLDIGLPGMDGRALARALRERPELAQSRFIAITGYGSAEDIARSRAAGFDHHLVKPLDLDALLRLLAEARPEPAHGR
ncbi:PAS domain S-box protein [Lysobacter sp. N42]|uniref:PAS domain S-box protein n=1 Tax=Lysobacter sp. N42 TaxID=2545719 RepID=UPI00104DA4B8|nr:PAS domain S-box protein [Lysobacter sp. N42]TCZ87716.1 PAS domain S-box protein [Lysobacter sp. N42]